MFDSKRAITECCAAALAALAAIAGSLLLVVHFGFDGSVMSKEAISVAIPLVLLGAMTIGGTVQCVRRLLRDNREIT
jgi:hypothetical protein